MAHQTAHIALRTRPRRRGTSLVRWRIALSAAALVIGVVLLVAQQSVLRGHDAGSLTPHDASGRHRVQVIELAHAIDSVSERYLLREMEEATTAGAILIVIRLDTPGGSLDSTRAIVGAMLESPTPLAVHVAPSGAHAASAGTFIASAAHFLAMSDVSEIGAASVVSLSGDDLSETLQAKANEDAAALMRSIALERGRDVAALEATVFEAKAYTAHEAFNRGIADALVNDLDELLEWTHGRRVTVDGRTIVLETDHYYLAESDLTFFERVLAFVANPNLAFLFLSLGGVGLIVELWNFGTWIPGILGITFLVLGFAGIGQLSFEWAGIALIAIGLVLLVLELTLAPGLGIFGVLSVLALMGGGIFLFPVAEVPELPGAPGVVNRWMLAVIGVLLLGAVLLTAREFRLDRNAVPFESAGSSHLVVGQTGVVVAPLQPAGSVRVAGEVWTAESENGDPVQSGATVTVTGVEGITLQVRAADSSPADDAEEGGSTALRNSEASATDV